MKQYLKDMKPTEVIDKLHAGNLVYYTDTKGKPLKVILSGLIVRILNTSSTAQIFHKRFL